LGEWFLGVFKYLLTLEDDGTMCLKTSGTAQLMAQFHISGDLNPPIVLLTASELHLKPPSWHGGDAVQATLPFSSYLPYQYLVMGICRFSCLLSFSI
jgi:hypothetical protein